MEAKVTEKVFDILMTGFTWNTVRKLYYHITKMKEKDIDIVK